MTSVALGARVLLAAVFAVAAIAKLVDQPGARRALAGFGMPDRSLVPLAFVLPLAELATAVGLVVQQSARWAAVCALGLLLVFIAGIASARAHGREPECHCFGRLSSAPAGRNTLIRNALLAVPAALVVAYGPGESLGAWLAARSFAELAAVGAGVAAVVLAALYWRLWRENRRMRPALTRAYQTLELFPPGLPIGVAAPRFALPTVDGPTVTLDELLERGKPVALVFMAPDCGSCAAMLEDLARWQRTLSDRLTIALLTAGALRDVRPFVGEHALENVLLQRDSEVFEAYRTTATPSTVILTPDGRIGSQTIATKFMVEALIRRALRGITIVPEMPSAAQNGEPLAVRHWSGAPALH